MKGVNKDVARVIAGKRSLLLAEMLSEAGFPRSRQMMLNSIITNPAKTNQMTSVGGSAGEGLR